MLGASMLQNSRIIYVHFFNIQERNLKLHGKRDFQVLENNTSDNQLSIKKKNCTGLYGDYWREVLKAHPSLESLICLNGVVRIVYPK